MRDFIYKVSQPFRRTYRFLKASWEFARYPKSFVQGVEAGRWPGGLGPKGFAAIASAATALCLSLHPVAWIDAFDELSDSDRTSFVVNLNLLGARLNDLTRSLNLERIRDGSSELSRRIEAACVTANVEDIELCLAKTDLPLARRFAAAVKKESLEDKILKAVLGLGVIPALVVSCYGIHWVCRRADLSPRVFRQLSLYFVGYYVCSYAVFTMLDRHVFAKDRGIVTPISIWVELIFLAILTVQLYRYYGEIFSCSKRRLTMGFILSFLMSLALIGALNVAVLGLLITDSVDHMLNHFAGFHPESLPGS